MSKKYEVADVLYDHITDAAEQLAGTSSYDTLTSGLEHLANAYAKVVEADKRSTMPS